MRSVRLKSWPFFQCGFRGLLPLLVAAASYGDVTVQNLDDTGPGSLRDAIENAPDGETINFDPSLAGGVIILKNSNFTIGNFVIRQSLVIDGSALGDAIVLDGNGNSRIFNVASTGSLILRGMELTNGLGRGGGAIASGGSLECESCTFYDNISTGNTGESGFGGAIFSEGPVTLKNCTLTRNRGDRSGGGIHMVGAAATITHCTIVQNGVEQVADRGRNRNFGVGGLSADNGGSYFVTNSIICQNYDDFELNRVEGEDIDPGTMSPEPPAGNLIGIDPFLSPLGDYGGPTLTMVPITGSPAIDGGEDAGLESDQRGAGRFFGSSSDSGAVELGGFPGSEVSSIQDPVVTLAGDRADFSGASSGLSLREAIVRSVAGSTITFAPSLSGQTISLTLGELVLRRKLEIKGDGLANPVILSGSDQSRVFYVEAEVDVALGDLAIEDGFVGYNIVTSDSYSLGGGAIFSAGELVMTRCSIKNSSAITGGGLFARLESRCLIDRCTFEGNEAGRDGGGGFLRGEVEVRNSTFAGNLAARDGFGKGGGLHVSVFNPISQVISTSTFFGNSARTGGGVYLTSGEMTQCTVIGNTGIGSAGGVDVNFSVGNPRPILSYSIVAGNQAPTDPDVSQERVLVLPNNLIGGEPMLGPLQDNGGPTATMIPLAGSPAINPEGGRTGEPYETDQRGYFRTIAGIADLGAVEAASEPFPQRLLSPVVTSGGDGFRQMAALDLENFSLREAVAYSAPGALITFSDQLPQSGLSLTGGEIEIPHALTIDGEKGGGRYLLDAQLNSRHFRVPAGRELRLENLRLENGFADKVGDVSEVEEDEIVANELAGGSVFAVGDLVVNGCEFISCRSYVNGGAIGAAGRLEVSESVFEGCLAGGEGGAIWAFSESENVTIRGTRFEFNRCVGLASGFRFENGGALSITLMESVFELEDCYFFRNQADTAGAIYLTAARSRIVDTSFVSNRGQSAPSLGGRFNSGFFPLPDVSFENCTWHDNRNLEGPVSEGSVSFMGGSTSYVHCTIDDPWRDREFAITEASSSIYINCLVSNPVHVAGQGGNPASMGNYEGPLARLSPPGLYGSRWPIQVPLPGSSALDIGVATDLEFDQRGLSRSVGLFPDAGAVERSTTGSDPGDLTDLEVTLAGDPAIWNGNLDELSLRHAMALAAPGSTITLGDEFGGNSINLTRGSLFVSTTLVIDGPTDSRFRLDPGSERLVQVAAGGDLTLRRATLAHLSQNILVAGLLRLDQCDVRSNTGEYVPGLFFVTGEMHATDCHFEGNGSSGDFGVCVFFSPSSGVFNRCSFIDNTSNLSGAIVALSGSLNVPRSLVIRSSTFSGNQGRVGAAINSFIPTVIDQSTIVSNRALGGVSLVGDGHEILNSVIALNESRDGSQITTPEAFEASNFLSGDPLLSSPGYFGGETMTMPPLDGSPVMDQGQITSLLTDQRGLPRTVGLSADLGAVEYQGRAEEFSLTFDLDSDRDGVTNGLEQALGRSPALADSGSPFDLVVHRNGTISTGYDDTFADLVVFKVTRSEDLVNFDTVVISNEVEAISAENGVLFLEDEREKSRYFYRVEVTRR